MTSFFWTGITGLLVAFLSIAQDVTVDFAAVIADSGIDFTHHNGASPEKYMPETMGSGALIFDYDNDGWSDIFFVDGGSFADTRVSESARHRLYRNNGRTDGTIGFTDVSDDAGIGKSSFGMGACSADYDNDGWDDIYVTSVGANSLYRNKGDGSFSDMTAEAGVGSDVWSSSCAFRDIDNDGNVDLYVTNYVDFAVDNNKYCGDIQDVRFYCHPNIYNGVADILYRNNGNGTFTDISLEAGVYSTEGKGLGVVFTDYDNDGWSDIYVANDSTPNFLFHNSGDGSFEETALLAGVAVGMDGLPLAGMGTDTGDVDGDGLTDLIVTNLDRQTHSVYRNTGGGLFLDDTYGSGVGEATLPFVGFGTVLFDYDNDRDLDLGIANGDVLDNIHLLNDSATYAQRNLLLENDGSGVFTVIRGEPGTGFESRKVSRAMTVGDLDNDGDLDVLVTNNGQTPDLLQNVGGNQKNSLEVHLIGTESNRRGIGARLTLSIGNQILVRSAKAGSSYLGQNDGRVHFGMGDAEGAEKLEIAWPSGQVDIFEGIEANRIVTVQEGGTVESSVPYSN
jgi:hypothetical protein